MTTAVTVPALPESVADATLVNWNKKPGDSVREGENLVDLETDKVVLEMPAPVSGVLNRRRRSCRRPRRCRTLCRKSRCPRRCRRKR